MKKGGDRLRSESITTIEIKNDGLWIKTKPKGKIMRALFYAGFVSMHNVQFRRNRAGDIEELKDLRNKIDEFLSE